MNNIYIQKFKDDQYQYFSLCVYVSRSRGTEKQAIACVHLRDVMIGLGYPAETADWDDEQTLNYADGMVMMG